MFPCPATGAGFLQECICTEVEKDAHRAPKDHASWGSGRSEMSSVLTTSTNLKPDCSGVQNLLWACVFDVRLKLRVTTVEF